MKLHAPERLQLQHVLEPQQGWLHGEQIRGDVVHVAEAELVVVRRRLRREPGPRVAVGARLDETKGRIAERRRDRKTSRAAAIAVVALDFTRRCRAILLQPREGMLDVGYLEHQAADALRVSRQVASGGAALPERSRADHVSGARTKGARALLASTLELGGAAPDLRKAQALAVEAADPFQIAHVVFEAKQPLEQQ
jgi:hypothetical protein